MLNIDYEPRYFTNERQFQARFEHDFGPIKAQLTGMYTKSRVSSQQDVAQAVYDRTLINAGLANFAATAAGTNPALATASAATRATFATHFAPGVAALLPNGPTGVLCTSGIDPNGVGAFGPNGGNATRAELPRYAIFRSNTPLFTVKSFGLFGEAYFELSDKIKLTGGVRYNKDKKFATARSTLANFLIPYGSTSAFSSPFVNGFAVSTVGAPASSRLNPFDADQTTPCSITSGTATGILTAGTNTTGCDLFQVRQFSFDEVTGRAVLDFKITDDNLPYVSYSRGYRSGGINPPLQPGFNVPDSFAPEIINAFEIGSKNTFANCKMRFNATAFYYKYSGLQLSRIVNRTAINDNINANIYGLELETVIRPGRGWAINMGASYLHTKVADDKLFANPRDPSGGRSDVVIIKDLQNASNCAVTPNTTGLGAQANNFVNTIGGALGLRPAGPFAANSGITANGAFGICGILTAAAAGNIGAANPALAALQGPLSGLFGLTAGNPLPLTINSTGVPISIRGNELPQAPNYKFYVGVQYRASLSSGMAITPRADLTYTGESFGNIFNGAVNKIPGYAQVNAQIQIDGKGDRWFARAWVQNLTNNSAITGLGVGDQSQGVFTGIFTLEPRRFGLTAGVKF